jgi:hypothetical protein
MIRMRHLGARLLPACLLPASLSQFNTATDNPALARWQQTADIIIAGVEKDNVQLAGFVLAHHTPWPPGAGRGLVMFDNQNIKGGDAAIGNFVQRRACTPVNYPDGQMVQHVNDMRTDPLLQRYGQFWPNARQHSCRCEQAEYFGGASWMHLWTCLLQNVWI